MAIFHSYVSHNQRVGPQHLRVPTEVSGQEDVCHQHQSLQPRENRWQVLQELQNHHVEEANDVETENFNFQL